MSEGIITKISGPLVVASNMKDVGMSDLVMVGHEKLIGEVLEVKGDKASIQVYEETSGLKPGGPVVSTKRPMSVELGPGLISTIFDGIQRPLEKIMDKVGLDLQRGVQVPALDRDKVWEFKATKKVGDYVEEGDIIGEVQETEVVNHKIMIPYGIKGTIEKIKSGNFKIEDKIATIKKENGETVELDMIQRWPVRKGRPYKVKHSPKTPLITGQRVVDALFPVAKGGVAAVPGPFGSGKTVLQHQLAKWADAQIVVYVGCGERGNEMTDVLNEFPELIDPHTGKSLMQRTVLIANTSDMPVAAREASIYVGITIAEYFRDMGYSVAMMADSTSRWAEALREMSGRLEEMPGEEGYPAYLGSRLAQFYERAGQVTTLGQDERMGAVSAIGAVSPPGGDISEPVTQATLRVVKVFWGLDSALAYARHFPAINWLTSYSRYADDLSIWFDENVAKNWSKLRGRMMALLDDESSLQEIVQLVGMDALSPGDRLKLEVARSIREDFLHQNSFHDIDTYTSVQKQHMLMELIMYFYDLSQEAINKGVRIEKIEKLEIKESIGRFKYTSEDDKQQEYDRILKELKVQLDKEIANKEVE